MENLYSSKCKIRPSGRHIFTIGRDLIQDSYAAIVELVKNAYDADSPDVLITFTTKDDNYFIVIEDHGSGMSHDTVINQWMVPSTDNKERKKTSLGGRILQGRKGIGRYSAAILGNHLELQTTTIEGVTTIAKIDWNVFQQAEYLDDVEIVIESKQIGSQKGTVLTISGKTSDLDWTQNKLQKLQFELKKLVPPDSFQTDGLETALDTDNKKDKFDILLIVENVPGVNDLSTIVKPYPIADLYDYKISGKVLKNGTGKLIYSSQKSNSVDEEIIIEGVGTNCGDLFFDIRVYDRDTTSLRHMIQRGLKDESNNYVGINQAKRILNDNNGIGVYRNNFRIRPLGDRDYDWLELNAKRVQNPSLRIGSDQVIGYVKIQSEENSGLVEKSARDGLKENAEYESLKKVTEKVLTELEYRRYKLRQKLGLGRVSIKVEKELNSLFSYEVLKNNVVSILKQINIPKETTEKLLNAIDEDGVEKSKSIEEVRKVVAIYQGQATLGKIINVVLHEGRHPLSGIRNEMSTIRGWYDYYQTKQDVAYLSKAISGFDGLEVHVNNLSELFTRIDPLATGNRGKRRSVDLVETILLSANIFNTIFTENRIKFTLQSDEKIQLICWPQDINAIFTNLIDNSIYWMSEKNNENREIKISIYSDNGNLTYIDYTDTGPGIERGLIENQLIFNPEFSMKPTGAGLGLAIAGEAAARNSLTLKAYESTDGAYFRLESIEKDEAC